MSEPLACLSRADLVECRAHTQPSELQFPAGWSSAARLPFPSCSSPRRSWRRAHRGREDLHGRMLKQPELWLTLLQEVD